MYRTYPRNLNESAGLTITAKILTEEENMPDASSLLGCRSSTGPEKVWRAACVAYKSGVAGRAKIKFSSPFSFFLFYFILFKIFISFDTLNSDVMLL
jgi:hypothetical protein